ncbi:MAG: histidine kinase, partial [Prolixibacteraceae bacterium]|nr:histidine kinase [Prolixibacteraceae bacterium]
MKELKDILIKRPGFWFYQIAGWIIFLIYDFTINIYPDNPKLEINLISGWLMFLFFGFSISIILRYIYKKLYKINQNLWKTLINIFLASVIAGFFWLVCRELSMFFTGLRSLDYFFTGVPGNIHPIFKFIGSLFFLTWPMFVWSLLYFGIKFRTDLLDERLRYDESQKLAQKATLQMLRYQLNPHFLFNTLNSIQGIMYHDIKLADKMLTELTEFLRYTLRDNEKVFVPLKKEIEIIEKYLLIEKIRFNEKLKYQFEVSSFAREIKVLCFLLQPIVENAIKFGMKTSPN